MTEPVITRTDRGYVKEAKLRAYLGGLSPRTLFTLKRQGLPSIKLPSGGVLYSLDAIDEWLTRYRQSQDKAARMADGLMRDLKEGE